MFRKKKGKRSNANLRSTETLALSHEEDNAENGENSSEPLSKVYKSRSQKRLLKKEEEVGKKVVSHSNLSTIQRNREKALNYLNFGGFRSYSDEAINELKHDATTNLLSAGQVESLHIETEKLEDETESADGAIISRKMTELEDESAKVEEEKEEVEEELLNWEKGKIASGGGTGLGSRANITSRFAIPRKLSIIDPATLKHSLAALQKEVLHQEESYAKSERELSRLQSESTVIETEKKNALSNIEDNAKTYDEIQGFRLFSLNLVGCLRSKNDTLLYHFEQITYAMRKRKLYAFQENDQSEVNEKKLIEHRKALKLGFQEVQQKFATAEAILKEFSTFKKMYPTFYNQSFIEESLPELLTPFVLIEVGSWDLRNSATITFSNWLYDLNEEIRKRIYERVLLSFAKEVIGKWWSPYNLDETRSIISLMKIYSFRWKNSLKELLQIVFAALESAHRLDKENDIDSKASFHHNLHFLCSLVLLEDIFLPDCNKIEALAISKIRYLVQRIESDVSLRDTDEEEVFKLLRRSKLRSIQSYKNQQSDISYSFHGHSSCTVA